MHSHAAEERADDDDDIAGGLPFFPCPAQAAVTEAGSAHSPPVVSWPVCPLCSRPLIFLLRIRTSLPPAAVDRLLYFFCCSDERCEDSARGVDEQSQQTNQQQQQLQAARWRVWRLTQRYVASAPASTAPLPQEAEEQLSIAQVAGAPRIHADDWGTGGDWADDNGDEVDSAVGDSAGAAPQGESDVDELGVQIERLILHRQRLHQQQPAVVTGQTPPAAPSSHSSVAVQRVAAATDAPQPTDDTACASSSASSQSIVPCARPFYLSWTPPTEAAAQSYSQRTAPPAAADEAVQRLLRQYESDAQCPEQSDGDGAAVRVLVDSSYVELGDEYERSSHSSFARFRRQLSSQPQQRIRYRSAAAQREEQQRQQEGRGQEMAAAEAAGSDSSDDDDENDESESGGDNCHPVADECLLIDGRMRRGAAFLSRTVCSGCGTPRSFECQLLGSLASDLFDVSSQQTFPLGWTTAALYTCRNAACRVDEMVDETPGLLVAS